MSAKSLLEEIRREGAAGTFDWQRTRERIFAEHERSTGFVERGDLVRLHAVLFDQVERSGAVPDGQLKAFRQARAQDYNLLLVREATANGNVVPQLLDAVTEREVAAARMAEDHELRILATQSMAMVAPPVPEPPPSKGIGGLLGRFRRKEPQAAPADASAAPEKTLREDDLFRAEVARLYELGVNPLEAIRALVSPNAGTTVDVKRLVGVWLGVQDLLDRTDVVNPIRGELVTVEGVLGQSVADTSDGSRAYIADYRRRAREIREMQVLQSYATKDGGGNIDFGLVRAMVADLERERVTPGSMAQAVSDEKMADLYRLIANWNDPSKLG